MFRLQSRRVVTTANNSTATASLLFSSVRHLAVVNRRRGTTHQQLAKPREETSNAAGEHITPPTAAVLTTTTSTPTNSASNNFLVREKHHHHHQNQIPIITMPTTANGNSNNNNLSANRNNNNDDKRPLAKIFRIISEHISEQEAFEQKVQSQNQNQQQREQDNDDNNNNEQQQEEEKTLEQLRQQKQKQQRDAIQTSKMSNDQKAVFFNRYSSTNFSAFASTAEEIIRAFRNTFKLPSPSIDENNIKSSSEQLLALPDSSESQQHQQQQQHLPKKKKMSTSIHIHHPQNQNSIVSSSSSSNEGEISNKSSSSSLLADYCGSSEDVLQLAMIVMQSCVDVSEISTARLLFALVVQEVPFHAIPSQFFRLYFLALSRSDTTTLEEFNGLVQLIGGRDGVKQNTVIALCVLEVKMRMGFNVTLGEVEEALSIITPTINDSNKQNDDKKNFINKNFSQQQQQEQESANSNNNINTPSFFMMSEEAEKRLKLRDCFLIAVRSHPDPRIATLLLREWTKLSDLSEFVGETNTIVHFLLVAANNSAASPALCAELISLLDGLSQQQQHHQDEGRTTKSSSTLASLVTLKTLVKTAARAIRSEDWKSFLTIEKFTNDLFLSSSQNSEQQLQQQQQDEGKTGDQQQNSSPEVLALISSAMSIFRILALIETNQPEKLLLPSSSPSSVNARKNLAFTMQLCPQLFNFNKKEDLDANICPFFLDKLIMTNDRFFSKKRYELATLINFPISEFPPMTLLLEKLPSENHALSLIEKGFSPLTLSQATNLQQQSSCCFFTETLTLVTAATFLRASNSNNNNNNASSSSAPRIIEILQNLYFSDQFSISKNPSASIMAVSQEDSLYRQHLKEILYLHKAHMIILNSALTFLKLISGALFNVQQAQRENIEMMMLYQEAESNLSAEVQLLVSYLVDDVLLNEDFFERDAEIKASEIFGDESDDNIGLEVKNMKREFLLEMARVLRKNEMKTTCEELEKLATKTA